MRHRAAGEAPHDRVDGLDLVDRDGVTDRDGLEQVAGLEGRSLVHERGEPLVEVETLALHRLDEGVRGRHALLQRVDDFRVGRVGLAALAELVEAGVLERDLLRLARGEPLERLALQAVEADTADRGRRRAEEAAAEPTVEPDRLEEARPAIARDVGDPELRHHLQHPVLERPEQATLRLVRCRAVTADLVRRRELRNGLEREPRADHVGAVADERRDHVRVAGLVARHDERAAHSPAALGEPHVGGRHREERRDRGALASRRTVAEADDRRATRDELDTRVRGALDGASKPLVGRERRVHHGGFERLQPVGRDEERRKDDERRQGPLRPERRAGTDERRDRHHGALAVVVDRRVRDLRELLAEVGRERPRTAGERCDRCVVAHGVDRLLARLRDRAEHEAQLLAGVAVQRLPREQVPGRLGCRHALLTGPERLVDPRGIGPPAREVAGQLAVESQPVDGVDREKLPRAEAGALDPRPLRQRNCTGLGADDDEPVVGDDDAQRP